MTLTTINALGIRPGKWVQNAVSGSALALLVALLALGALAGRGDPGHFVPFLSGDERPGAVAMALVPVFFAYCGWNAATYLAGEIRRPERNLARALALGTATCILLYLAVNAVYLYALSLPALRASRNAAMDAAAVLGGRGPTVLVTAVLAVAVLGSLQAAVLTGPRIYQAMAADGLFFPALARIHPRTRVPVMALLAQGGVACALLLSGTFERLLTFTTTAIVVFSSLTVAGVFVLRARRPALPRPFRTPGYPVTPAYFLALHLWGLASVVRSGAREALAGLAIVFTGVPAYGFFRTRGGVAAAA